MNLLNSQLDMRFYGFQFGYQLFCSVPWLNENQDWRCKLSLIYYIYQKHSENFQYFLIHRFSHIHLNSMIVPTWLSSERGFCLLLALWPDQRVSLWTNFQLNLALSHWTRNKWPAQILRKVSGFISLDWANPNKTLYTSLRAQSIYRIHLKR
jgi:hypothetical protein